MLNDIMSELESMTEEQKAAILATDFGADLEKEASDQVAAAELLETAYAYGALAAEAGVAEAEGVEKVASAEAIAEHEEEVAAVAERLEQLVAETGVADEEDNSTFQKSAQAIAQAMFEGFTDCHEKLAAAKGKAGMIAKAMGKMKHTMHKGMAAAKKNKAVKLVRKHPGKSALVAAGVGAAGYGAHKAMQKKASEATLNELADAIVDQSALIEEVSQDMDKLAAKGAGKAMAFAKKHLAGAKAAGGKAVAHVKKHKGLYGAGAGGAAVGAAATHAAHKASE